MTNEEAIKILSKVTFYWQLGEQTLTQNQINEALDMAFKVLEQTSWIPVSERLPEDNIHVLCQFTLGGMGECYLAHGVFHVVGGLVMTCNEVIAWMPLPKPYEPQESEEMEDDRL